MAASHQDVQIAFFRDGVPGVLQMIEDGSVTGFSLRRALREIESKSGPATAATLRQMLDEKGFMPGSGAPTKPEPGDVRTYKVQEGKSGLFVRGPVDHMNVKKGDKVRIRFTVGGFTAEQEKA